MKNIFISKPYILNPKFINFLSITNNSIVNNDNINIYEYFYRNIKTFIIHEHNIDNTALTFMQDHIDKVKVILYLENKSDPLFSHPNILHISRLDHSSNDVMDISKYTIKNIFNIKSHNQTKIDNTIACFIDHVPEMTYELTNIIEQVHKKPNLKIRLFNNPQIHNPYNIGLLSEKDKAYVLKTHEYFLDNGSEYIDEAKIIGSKIITSSDIQDIENKVFDINDISEKYDDISSFNEKFCI